jgi:eukaryotic-like serine/threonine-protein kinase
LTAALSNDDEPCPYQVIAPMAEDARGVIYLAQPIARPRGYVALKVHGPRDDVDAVLARYRRWRPAVERLGHPSIGRLLDIGTTADGCLYVATEYIPGRLLTAHGIAAAMGADGKSAIARQLSTALDEAHAAGLVHLRLDPSKIKVSLAPAPHATILGLGTALIVDGAGGDPELDRRALADILERL